MRVILKSQYKTHYAQGEFDGRGIMVLKGSQINAVDLFPKMSNIVKNIDIIVKLCLKVDSYLRIFIFQLHQLLLFL